MIILKYDRRDENEKGIPEEYEYDCETDEFYEYRNRYNGEVIHIAKKPPLYVKAIPVPEGATNGDVIKALFPNESDFETDFDSEWWNAPYRKER